MIYYGCITQVSILNGHLFRCPFPTRLRASIGPGRCKKHVKGPAAGSNGIDIIDGYA